MSEQEQYRKDRAAAYDGVIGIIGKHIESIPPVIALDINLVSPTAALQAARRDAWSQLLRGVKHLKDGGPQGQPGSFSSAVAMACLRGTPLATTLGVRPPNFIDTYFEMPHEGGAAEARYFCYALIGAVLHDAPASRKAIQHKIAAAGPVAAKEDLPAIADPELARVFGAAMKSSAREDGGDEMVAALRRQTVLSLNMLFDAYTSVTAELKGEMKTFFSPPPPKPQMKSHSFDF